MKVYLRTLGCRLNQSEIDSMARQLERRGHEIVDDVALEQGRAVHREVDRDLAVHRGGGRREEERGRTPAGVTGAVGLDVIDGQHVLIAEEAESFARACLRLRDDPDAAGRLVSEARGLWERRYRWGALRDAVVSAVGTATARSGAAAPGEGRVA